MLFQGAKAFSSALSQRIDTAAGGFGRDACLRVCIYTTYRTADSKSLRMMAELEYGSEGRCGGQNR